MTEPEPAMTCNTTFRVTPGLAGHVMYLACGANDLARSPGVVRFACPDQFSTKGALNWVRAASD